MARLVFHQRAWDALKEQVVETDCVERMKAVAAAANAMDGLTDGYRVSTEGSKRLRTKDRATVITATAPAMAKNAKHGTLAKAFNQAAG